MTQSVKKYHYSVQLPNKCHKDIVVNNAAHLNGKTYIATSNTDAIMRFDTNKEGKLLENAGYVNDFSKIKVKFIGFIKEKLAIIPKHTWEIHVKDNNCKEYKSVTIKSQTDLKSKIINSIIQKNNKSCHCAECYQLIGFVEYYGFNIFVQLSCKHKEGQNLLYVIKANLNAATLECDDKLEVTNEYNYYRLCLDNGLSEKHARGLVFTGLHYDGNKVYLISAFGTRGQLWEMSYFNNISYLAPPKLISKLRRNPTGIYSHNSDLVILCSNIEHQKINYYIITH